MMRKKKGHNNVFHAVNFAVKLLKATLDNREKIKKEIEKSLDVHDPHFVEIYGAGHTHKFSIIVMELAATSLEKMICDKEDEIELEEIEKIIEHVGQCMEYMADKFCHRDIKPSNILLFNNGDYKLTDLGVSVKLNSTSSTAYVVKGTEEYLSHNFK